ncbi:MAG: OmpA family protein [Leptospiraceae bacterium]|nr:OmpA family protein [Leptospiraceae bacterium]
MSYLLLFLFSILGVFAQGSVNLPEGKFGFPLNTQNNEYSPQIAPNGRYIVFQSNRPGGVGGMDLWLSENKNFRNRTGKPEWGTPVNFKELNTPGFEGQFTILFDDAGKPIELYFTSQKDGTREGLRGLNIYYTKNLTNKNLSTDKWSSPEHIIEINSNFEDKMPTISSDGKTLVFSSNRPGGYGGFDLWVSHRDKLENKWSRPINLGEKVNSISNEIMPSIHFDNATLYYSSDKENENYKYDFYKADIEDDSLTLSNEELESLAFIEKEGKSPFLMKFTKVTKLGKPFNSEADDEGISFTTDGLWMYYSSNRIGGEGQFDIYRIQVPEELRREYAFELKGIVVDGSEKVMIGLDSTIKIYNGKGLLKVITSKRIGGDITSKQDTEPVNFKTRLLTGSSYKVEVSSPGFHPNDFVLDLKGSVGLKKSKYLKIILLPVDEEKEEIIPNEPLPTPKKEPIEEIKPVPPKQISSTKIVLLKDIETKSIITDGSVVLFEESNRKGVTLPKDKEGFILEKMPENGFELNANAKGYDTETLIIKKEDTIYSKKEVIEIYLKKTSATHEIYSQKIYFLFNDTNIQKQYLKKLDELALYLKKNKEIIEVGGHTDNIAGKDYNLALSEKRAKVIKDYLNSKGVDGARIITKAYWYSMPDADNETEEGRTKNRRVTFKKLN